jgi:hypothetical protein
MVVPLPGSRYGNRGETRRIKAVDVVFVGSAAVERLRACLFIERLHLPSRPVLGLMISPASAVLGIGIFVAVCPSPRQEPQPRSTTVMRRGGSRHAVQFSG